jgi:hypothetical protein
MGWQGVLWDPRDPPWVGSPALEEGGPSLVDCVVVVRWLCAGCVVVLKVSSPGVDRLRPRRRLSTLS